MLVLTRAEKESIVVTVGEHHMLITVERIAGNRVRIGFTAPQQFAVVRTEAMDKAMLQAVRAALEPVSQDVGRLLLV